MKAPARVGLAIVAALAGTAAADPNLVLDHAPPALHMRPRRAAQGAKKPAPPKPIPMPAAPVATALEPDYGEDATTLRDVHDRVSVRFDLGYVVDGAQLTGKPTLGGKLPADNADFATLRSYAFGDAYFSSRGVVAPSLSSYFAMRFQAARELHEPQLVGTAYAQAMPPPIGTWFDRSGVDLRTGWLEVKDFLPANFGLQPLRIRAGDFYVYGPWMLHMDGALAGWDGKIFSISAYAGSRVPDYTLSLVQDRPTLAGLSLRADLRGLSSPLPITLALESLLFTQSKFSEPSRHVQFEADWRPRKDITLIGQSRFLDGKAANEHFQLRSSYRQVTNLVFDVQRREANDWLWDPSFIAPDTDPTSARRYLDLGPVIPQLTASARGGTVLYDNIDVLVRGAVATDQSDPTAPKSNFTTNYVEVGGALEVRLRRTIALGASILQRTLDRSDFVSQKIFDVPGPQFLPATAALGERSFVEVGTSAKMTLGARAFNAIVEVYGRRTHYAEDYCTPDPMLPSQCVAGDGVAHHDLRGGGRFTVDAWIGKRLRLAASYELSSALDLAPEISGYKSLRLMMEGLY